MNTLGDPRGEIAAIARQARDLLGRVRESRWSGFEPPAAAATPRAGAAGPAAPARKSPTTTAKIAVRQHPAPSAPVPAAMTTTPAPAEPLLWNSLEQIALAVSTCTKCPLHATRTKTAPGEGDPRARLMFVGEAPGEEEDRLGRPFVGAAGRLLDQMVGAMGLAREKVFIANILKCRPPGNRDPLEHEIAACLPYLRAQIALIGPEVICTLGRPAAQTLLERKDAIGRLRGRFFAYRGTPLLPTYHPAYLLRTPADKKLAWADLQQIMQRLAQPLPEQQQLNATTNFSV